MRIRDSQLNSHPLTFVWFTSSCGGSGDANVRATFSAFDADGDGFLSLEEMTLYIASIFRVRYETHGAGGIDATPDELAAATAAECFADAGLADGDELSFEAFYEWYAAGTAPSAAPAMALGIVEGADAPPAAVVSGLRAMRDGLGLVGRDVDSIFELFAQVRLGGGRFLLLFPRRRCGSSGVTRVLPARPDSRPLRGSPRNPPLLSHSRTRSLSSRTTMGRSRVTRSRCASASSSSTAALARRR